MRMLRTDSTEQAYDYGKLDKLIANGGHGNG